MNQGSLKVYGTDIEAQLVCTKVMDHEVYTSCIRWVSQMDSKHSAWTDLDRARIFVELEFAISVLVINYKYLS